MSARKWKTSTWEGAHEGREVEEGVVGVGLGAEGGSHGGVGDGTVEGCAEGGYIGVWAGSGGCNADGLKCKRSGRGLVRNGDRNIWSGIPCRIGFQANPTNRQSFSHFLHFVIRFADRTQSSRFPSSNRTPCDRRSASPGQGLSLFRRPPIRARARPVALRNPAPTTRLSTASGSERAQPQTK